MMNPNPTVTLKWNLGIANVQDNAVAQLISQVQRMNKILTCR